MAVQGRQRTSPERRTTVPRLPAQIAAQIEFHRICNGCGLFLGQHDVHIVSLIGKTAPIQHQEHSAAMRNIEIIIRRFTPASCRWRKIENTVCPRCLGRPGKYPGRFPRWNRNLGCKGLLQIQAIHQTTHPNIKSIRPGEVREPPKCVFSLSKVSWRQPYRCV